LSAITIKKKGSINMTKTKNITKLEERKVALDEKIEKAENRLKVLKQSRQDLEKQIETAKLLEIKGLLEERNISYEEAKEILKKDNPVIDSTNQY